MTLNELQHAAQTLPGELDGLRVEIDAARDARNALVDLAKALGGGWSAGS